MVRSHHTRLCTNVLIYVGFIQPCSTIEWNKSRKSKCRIKTSQPPPKKKVPDGNIPKLFWSHQTFMERFNIRIKQVTEYTVPSCQLMYIWKTRHLLDLFACSPNCCMAKPGNPSPRSAPIRQQLSPKVERPPAETGSSSKEVWMRNFRVTNF